LGRLGLPLAGGILLARLYFRQGLLTLAAALLILGVTEPLLESVRLDSARSRRRRAMTGWLEELAMGLRAGLSLPAVTGDLADRILQNGGRDKPLLAAWRDCRGRLALGYPIGRIYQDLALAVELPEMRFLAAVLNSAVQTGVSLTTVLLKSAASLREQIEVKESLAAYLSARRLEGSLLAAAPAVFTGVLRLTAPAYMAPLFEGPGRVIMLIVFGLQLLGAGGFFRLLLGESWEGEKLALADFQEGIALQMQAGLNLPAAWQQAANCQIAALAGAEKEAIRGKRLGQKEKAKGAGGERREKRERSERSERSERREKREKGERGDKGDKGEKRAAGGILGTGAKREKGAKNLALSLALIQRQLAFGASFTGMLSALPTMEGAGDLAGLAALIRQNHRLGGAALAAALQQAATEERRRYVRERKARGGRQEIWLLFPMIVLLISALLLTAGPALLSL
jgi:Flp pilus assembly protein TadB